MNRRTFGTAVISASASVAALAQAATPKACSTPKGGLGEQDFRNYIAAFNRSDFDGFSKYYAADVKFEGRGGTFTSRDQVLAFYRQVKARIRETITIKDVVVGDNDLVANIVTELFALEDWPEFPTGPMKKGQIVHSENFVWYEIKNAKFVHIRSAGYLRS